MKQYGNTGASSAGPTNLGFSGKAGPGFRAVQKVKKVAGAAKAIAKEAYKNPGQAAKFVGKQVMANKGKAGLALGALAAAGGLGMAGLKAVGARKKKANSLQGRLSSAMKKVGR